jgi:hypothetical protein
VGRLPTDALLGGGRKIAHSIGVQRIVLMLFLAALGSVLPSVESSTAMMASVASIDQQPLLQGNQVGRTAHTAAHPTLTKEARLAFIRKAQVWKPTDIPNMDLRTGPDGAGTFQPNEMVTCNYAEAPKHGATRKFHCTLPDGNVVKVRYGERNGEVEGQVLATRLLWALGFAADRVYPVRVTCRGCSSDPWTVRGSRNDVHEFDPAVIERKPFGHEMWDDGEKSNWSWRELDLVDANQGGAPQEQRDALKLLAVFMQHTDTKSEQQRLLCVSDELTATGECSAPFLLLHDVGLTFGHANIFNHNSSGSVNLEAWSRTPIWRDPAACIGHLSKSHTGTLGDPRVSEAGREFLADLLVQLTDQQLRDLFEVARVDRRADSSGNASGARVEDWVAAFKSKRNEIVTNHCAR